MGTAELGGGIVKSKEPRSGFLMLFLRMAWLPCMEAEYPSV